MSNIISEAIKALKIDRPILNWRMVGTGVELFLYGGQVVFYDPEKPKESENHNQLNITEKDLVTMKLGELYQVARSLGIKDVHHKKRMDLQNLVLDRLERNR